MVLIVLFRCSNKLLGHARGIDKNVNNFVYSKFLNVFKETRNFKMKIANIGEIG